MTGEVTGEGDTLRLAALNSLESPVNPVNLQPCPGSSCTLGEGSAAGLAGAWSCSGSKHSRQSQMDGAELPEGEFKSH